jgi:hypothetical protein
MSKARAKEAPGKAAKKNYSPDSTVGRHEIINSAEMPTFYTQATGKRKGRHPIRPELAKALLQYLVPWDFTGRPQYKSLERVAHEMKIPLSTLNHVVKALVEAGMLVRKFRAMGKTYQWIPQWDVIAANPMPYVPKPGAPKEPDDDDEEEEEPPTDDEEPTFDQDEGKLTFPTTKTTNQAQQPGDEGSLARELHGMFVEFKGEERLPLGAVTKLIKSLASKFKSFTRVQLAVRAMERWQLISVINDGVQNPPAYLRVVLETAIADRISMEKQGGDQHGGGEDEKQAGERNGEAFPLDSDDDEGELRFPPDDDEPTFPMAKDHAEAFAAVWANKTDGVNEDGQPVYYRGPASEHLIPILQDALANDDPRREHMVQYIAYVFMKSGYYRKVPLEQAARTFAEKLPAWIVAFDKEYPDSDPPAEEEFERDEDEDDVPF